MKVITYFCWLRDVGGSHISSLKPPRREVCGGISKINVGVVLKAQEVLSRGHRENGLLLMGILVFLFLFFIAGFIYLFIYLFVVLWCLSWG